MTPWSLSATRSNLSGEANPDHRQTSPPECISKVRDMCRLAVVIADGSCQVVTRGFRLSGPIRCSRRGGPGAREPLQSDIGRLDGIVGDCRQSRCGAYDRALMACLRHDGRAGHVALQAAVGLSEPSIRRRIDRLRATGVLYFDVQLDPGRRTIALLWLTTAPSALDDAGRALGRHPEVASPRRRQGPATSSPRSCAPPRMISTPTSPIGSPACQGSTMSRRFLSSLRSSNAFLEAGAWLTERVPRYPKGQWHARRPRSVRSADAGRGTAMPGGRPGSRRYGPCGGGVRS